MPCPHFSISICKRSENKSAVASAAYQSGQSLFSERDHRTKAYSNKQGVLFSDILLPEHVPKEFENRAYLWNSVEKNEKSWNAYNELKKELAPVKEELEELKKIKYFISKVMPAGTGGTAGDNFDAPVIDIPAELPSFKEQIKEAKQEAKDYNDSREEEVRKTPNNSTPSGRDDD